MNLTSYTKDTINRKLDPYNSRSFECGQLVPASHTGRLQVRPRNAAAPR